MRRKRQTSLGACRAKASLTAISRVKIPDDGEPRTFHRRDHHLRNPCAGDDLKRFSTMVDEDDPDFPPIVCVHGSRGIEHGDTVTKRQTRSWSYLRFHPGRQGQPNAGTHHCAPARLEQ